MNNKLSFVIFLFLLSTIFAQPSDTEVITEAFEKLENDATSPLDGLKASMADTCGAEESFVLDLIGPSVLAALALILLSTLVYMVGKVLQSKKVLQIAREEYYQSGISIFLAFVVLVFIGVTNSLFISLNVFGYETGSILDKAISISFVIADQIATDLSVLMIFNGVLTYFAASSISFGSFHSSVHISPGLALKPITDVVTLLIQFLAVSLSEWVFHIFSLCLIKKWALAVFLPFGMLLRAIPHTRDGGSAIIALMLVLYLIYPITFIGMGAIYYTLHGDLDLQAVAVGMVSEFFLGMGLVGLLFKFITGSFLMAFVLFGAVDAVWIFVKEGLFMFFVMSLMLPFISILIALTAAKELAKNFFGVDINLSSIIRVI